MLQKSFFYKILTYNVKKNYYFTELYCFFLQICMSFLKYGKKLNIYRKKGKIRYFTRKNCYFYILRMAPSCLNISVFTLHFFFTVYIFISLQKRQQIEKTWGKHVIVQGKMQKKKKVNLNVFYSGHLHSNRFHLIIKIILK